MDALDQAIEKAGGVGSLARKIGVVQGTVSNWRGRGTLVPVEHCTAVEQATNAQVTRKDLRPHDWQKHWPELEQNHLPARARMSRAATKNIAQA